MTQRSEIWRVPVRWALVVTTAILSAFQLSAALGAPVGRWAYGGAVAGTLPAPLRISSAVATVVWGAVALAVARLRLPPGKAARWGLRVLAVFAGLSVVLNAMSRSLPERLTWAPVSLAMALCAALLSSRSDRPTDRRDAAPEPAREPAGTHAG